MSGFGHHLENASDQQLLEYFQQGSVVERENACSALYQRYNSPLFRFINSRVHSEQDAQDILSDVWVITLSKLMNFVWQEDTKSEQPLKSWLFAIASNKIKEYFRKVAKETIIELENVVALIELKLNDEGTAWQKASPMLREKANQLMHDALHDALNQLNPTERRVLTLTYYERKNSTQIGEILNIKPGTVRQHRRRGLKKLRKILAAYFPGKGGNQNA